MPVEGRSGGGGEGTLNHVVMRRAAEALYDERLRMSTGSAELDGLIGGVEVGLFYLFYGDREALDALIHRLLVNCVLPRERGGLQAKGIYFNNTDYYTGKTVLNPSLLGAVAKRVGIEPMDVFRSIYTAAAYNEERQLVVANQVAELMERDPDIKLLAIHSITRFLADSKRVEVARGILKRVVNLLWRAAASRGVALVVTADAMQAGRGLIPRPLGGSFLRHAAGIITYLRRLREDAIKAYLIKHPCRKTPESITLYASEGGVDLMGRITPSFRRRYEEAVGELKTSYQSALIELGHREAFDLLLKEAWGVEQAAMGNSNLPTVIDALNITANIHNRKLIELLRRRLEERERVIQELQRRLEALEARVGGGARSLKDG
jgi:RecA/RadA recombinase